MLEFNQEHKLADLSAIKSKTDRAKNVGKVVLCGIALSSVLLLSGCSSNQNKNEELKTETPVSISTAIIMENGNAVIVDVSEYIKYVEYRNKKYVLYSDIVDDRNWVLVTVDGDHLLVDYESVKIVDGENSHQKAETIAQGLISESGKITCYDEVETYGKNR